MKNQRKMRFVRIRGRIVPIAVKNEVKAVKDLGSRKNARDLSLIAGSAAGASGGLYASGRLQRSQRLFERVGKASIANKFNKAAKLVKFGAPAAFALIAASALTRIDKRSRDEKAKVFNVGSKATTGLGIAMTLVGGFAAIRLGKRFEVGGKKALNLFRKSDIKKLRIVKDV